MAGCDVPRLECLHIHIRQRLPDAGTKPNDTGDGYRTLCPAHRDHDPSLSISVGGNQRIVWNCFAGCDQLRTRAALIDIYRIDRECLPVSRTTETSLMDAIEDILCLPTKEDTFVRLQALARLRGFRGLPKGADLLRLGSDIGVGRSQAFEYARRLRATPGNYVPKHARQPKSSIPGQAGVSRPAKSPGTRTKSGNPDSEKSGNPDSPKRRTA